MAFDCWSDAAEALERRLASPDASLRDLASRLGLSRQGRVDRAVLIARIEDAVAAMTLHNPPRPSTKRQNELLDELGVKGSGALSLREADALIQVAIANERLQALRELRPTRGDRLVCVRARGRFEVGEVIEVSSIDRLGQIWVRRAGGFPALPQDLQRLPA